MSEVYEREIKKVSVYMIKDHQRVFSLLHAFEMSFEKELDERLQSFSIFEWHLQKHIFVEEKAIFSIFNFKKYEDDYYELFLELSDQHLKIQSEIKDLKDNLKLDYNISTVNLRDLLNNHLKFEEEIAYPRLDDLLSESERKKIFDNIKDIL